MNPTDRLSRVITSAPIDSVAARVVSAGYKYEKSYNGHESSVLHSAAPPRVKRPTDERQAALIGMRFGRMTVLGVSAERKARYVVQCDCSMYEIRSARAITNPANFDACLRCRQTAYLKRSDLWRSTGREKPLQEFLGREEEIA